MTDTRKAFYDADACKRFGRALDAWIKYAGIRKTRLSDLTALSRTTIDALIKGERPPETPTVAALAMVLNTTPGTLLDGQFPPASTLRGDGEIVAESVEGRLQAVEAVLGGLKVGDLAAMSRDIQTLLELVEQQPQVARSARRRRQSST